MSNKPVNSKLIDAVVCAEWLQKTQTINLLECKNENFNQENFWIK